MPGHRLLFGAATAAYANLQGLYAMYWDGHSDVYTEHICGNNGNTKVRSSVRTDCCLHKNYGARATTAWNGGIHSREATLGITNAETSQSTRSAVDTNCCLLKQVVLRQHRVRTITAGHH